MIHNYYNLFFFHCVYYRLEIDFLYKFYLHAYEWKLKLKNHSIINFCYNLLLIEAPL